MTNKFASKKRAIAECDVCGFQFKLRELRSKIVRGRETNILACPECFDGDHPQNRQGMFPVDDPQAVKDPRPDKNLEEQRSYQYGFDPVGLNNPLQLEGLVDNLKSNGQIGSVSITTT